MNYEKLMNEPVKDSELEDILFWFDDVYGKETYQYIQVFRLINAIKSK